MKIIFATLIVLLLYPYAMAQTNYNGEEYTNDYLAEQYIQKQLSLKENALYATFDASSNLKGITEAVFPLMYDFVKKIAEGKQTSTKFSVAISDIFPTSYTAKELGVKYILNNGEVVQEVKDMVYVDFDALFSALMEACPYEMYWYDKTEGANCNNGDYSVNSYYNYIKLSGNITIDMCVSSEYRATASDPYTVNSVFGESIALAKQNIASILERYADEDDYGKLIAYKNEICSLVSYDYDALNTNVYGNPWQIVYVFDGISSTNVVCEGYAKAFKYLCDNTNFDCNSIYALTVSGYLDGSGHMWNVVHMDNGENYLVDVTNMDYGMIAYPNRLFLKGRYSGNLSDGYVISVPQVGYKNYYTYTYNSRMWGIFTDSQLMLATSDYNYTEITDISDTDISMLATEIYTGKPIMPNNVTVYDNNVQLVYNKDYIYEVVDNINVGAATVEIFGIGNYKGSRIETFDIQPANISNSELLNVSSPTYNGSALIPTIQLAFNDISLIENIDYTISYSNNINAGTATATIIGIGNFTGEKTVTFDILPSPISLTRLDFESDGSSTYVSNICISEGVQLVEDVDYTVSYTDNSVILNYIGNYTGTQIISLPNIVSPSDTPTNSDYNQETDTQDDTEDNDTNTEENLATLVSELDINKNFNVYPNPALCSENVTIQLPSSINQEYNIAIYTINGCLVRNIKKTLSSEVVSLPAGIYIIQLTVGNIVHTSKLLVR